MGADFVLDGVEPSGIQAAETTRDGQNNSDRQARNVPSWLDQTAIATANKTKTRYDNDVGMGYSMLLPDDDPLQNSDPLGLNANSEMRDILNLNEHSNAQLEGALGNLGPDFDPTPVYKSPSPPLTYSFQESTFARRLHRACAEAAYALLLNPRRRPAEYERIFRLSLLGRDRARITANLRSVINRGPHEDLDFWEAPTIHVGGAGTHYPRRDAYGNLLPKKSSYNVGRVGPQTLSILETAYKANMNADMSVDLIGYEGEWFDPYDVQGYLEEKGIYIDPTSSFAEAQIVEWGNNISDASTIEDSESLVAASPRLTPFGKATPLTTFQVNALISEADVDFSKWDDSANLELTNVGYSDANQGSWMNFMQPGQSIRQYNPEQASWEQFNAGGPGAGVDPRSGQSSVPATPQPKRKSVLIDVTKLVKGE
jgi:hypothetical protein